MFKKLWMDEGGAALASAELILLATVVTLALVVGGASLADAINSELADVGQAFNDFDQSFTVAGDESHSSAKGPSSHVDANDFCEGGTSVACLELNGNANIATSGTD